MMVDLNRGVPYAHAIVGYGMLDYFFNAINAVFLHDPDSKLIIVSTDGVSGKDLQEYMSTKYKEHQWHIFEVDHDPSANIKVGNLYKAYNLILDFCYESNIDYINLMQNDMQMIGWSGNICSLYIEILKKTNALQVATGFVRKGSHPSFYKQSMVGYQDIYFDSIERCKSIVVLSGHGMGDWGFISIVRMKEKKLSFMENEGAMDNLVSNLGFSLPFSPIPFVVPIPFPATIRHGRQVGSMVKSDMPLLLKPKFDNWVQLILNYDGKLWQEDWVCSWGWWSLEPTWATDFSLDYLKCMYLEYKRVKVWLFSA